MKLIICIDDTGNGNTGEIACKTAEMLKTEFRAKISVVTSHSLMVINGLSNCAACFTCEINEKAYASVAVACCEFIKAHSEANSNPGIAVINPKKVKAEELIKYGKAVKERTFSKREAYAAAEKCGAFVTELGGSGKGVVGALAGAGLRLWGEDGVLRSTLRQFRQGERYTVSELLTVQGVEQVELADGSVPAADETVLVSDRVKPRMLHGRLVILVEESSRGLRTVQTV